MKAKLLGSLENKIMSLFWQHRCQYSIADIHTHLNKQDQVAYTTIATIVGRLVKKGLLIRNKTGRGYIYNCTQTKDEFISSRSRGLIKSLLGNFGDVAIAGFVEELRNDPVALEKLRRLSRDIE